MFKRVFSKKKESVEEILNFLDYEPKLEIIKIGIHFGDRYIILADGRSSRPKKPTSYVINISKGVDEKEFAVRLASRAVRCRRQSGEDKLETFSDIKMPECFYSFFSSIYFMTWGKYEADSEIIAVIAERLYIDGISLDEISQMLLMNASEINERYLKKG
ncbi:MAG: hypothetical protein PHX92_00250 [Candidatus Pacebacteria bacterium]|nr:hypothetical protein [Candidatus Paceibacterota bacterium]